ncbi:hypothetical protein SAMN04488137_0043 [Fictibacillus solisalsi]|uniref:Uncharacterized protein n=1 Tax=Fictibacillus solisalsi TaxID=459525 RepID=A0A1H0CTB4_9BACL|nr:hypothetical protein SAMN04488137_0043 [Fictibacillus solisalsi]
MKPGNPIEGAKSSRNILKDKIEAAENFFLSKKKFFCVFS